MVKLKSIFIKFYVLTINFGQLKLKGLPWAWITSDQHPIDLQCVDEKPCEQARDGQSYVSETDLFLFFNVWVGFDDSPHYWPIWAILVTHSD